MNMLAMIPWDNEANIGRFYNEQMARLSETDWAIFVDHDAMPTTGLWHRQFQEAAAFLPEAGAIVAMTNRIASTWQRAGDYNSNDYAVHRMLGATRAKIRTLLDITPTKGFGGVAFALSKRAWRKAGGFAHGLGCVDHSYFFRAKAAGMKIWMHEGIYYYHWRHWGSPDPTAKFPKAPNCPCRGKEAMPTERIALP